MTEARPVADSQANRSTCVRSSALTVLVLLLFTSGVFAVGQTGYGPAACRVLVSEAQDRVLPGESRSLAAAASAEHQERDPHVCGVRPVRRALRVIEGLPAPRAPDADV